MTLGSTEEVPKKFGVRGRKDVPVNSTSTSESESSDVRSGVIIAMAGFEASDTDHEAKVKRLLGIIEPTRVNNAVKSSNKSQ